MFENMEMSFDLMPGFNAVFGALEEEKNINNKPLTSKNRKIKKMKQIAV